MQRYKVETPLRGLRRADGLNVAIEPGEVVELPDDAVGNLFAIGAIALTDEAVTCPLDWEAAPAIGPAQFDSFAMALGLAFQPGQGLPDRAVDLLAYFSNAQLLDELGERLQAGQLSADGIAARFGFVSWQLVGQKPQSTTAETSTQEPPVAKAPRRTGKDKAQ